MASSVKPPSPSIRQKCRHLVWDAAIFKMTREDRKPHQQQEQVCEDHGFVLHVQREAA